MFTISKYNNYENMKCIPNFMIYLKPPLIYKCFEF